MGTGMVQKRKSRCFLLGFHIVLHIITSMTNADLKTQQGNATPASAHSVIPDNSEYYTLDLDRTPDDDEGKAPFDISSSDDGISVTGSSSFYNGTVTATTDDNDDVPNTDLGGVKKREEITDQNTTSADVGNPGHWGIDEDTG